MNKKVSVIIPTYNRAEVLPRAVESVLKQTYKNWELILVDDGSTDSTDELLKTWAGDPRIQTLRIKNQGVSFARNRGVEIAKGEWLSFLDSDDEWLPEKLDRQMALLGQKPELKIIHGEEIWIRKGVRVNPMKKHQKRPGDIFSDALKLCCISPSTVLLEKELFQSMGGFREDFPVCEDYDLWLKITSQYPVGFVSDPIIRKFGGHSDQLSKKYFAMDYWRVLAIEDLLQSDLSQEKRQLATRELNKKRKVLLKGYRKHENLQNFDQIFQMSL